MKFQRCKRIFSNKPSSLKFEKLDLFEENDNRVYKMRTAPMQSLQTI